VIDALTSSGEYAQNFGDYGVPGSPVRYCGPGQSAVTPRGNRQMRFAGMDTNNNGIIERSEWNGTRETFVVEDWNGDNVLSGEEVAPAGRRAGRRAEVEPVTPEPAFTAWNATTFTNLDRNRDGRLAATEWLYDTESFVRADRNNDRILTRAEFLNGAEVATAEPAATTANDFAALDTNRNGRLERSEWRASADAFQWLDRNKDGILSRTEVVGVRSAADEFAALDANGDGRLTVAEWNGTRRAFNLQDADGNGVLTRREFSSSGAVPTTGR
jgi:hypothetical protein